MKPSATSAQRMLGCITPGLSKRDRKLITHLAFYGGWPTAVSAAVRARSVGHQPLRKAPVSLLIDDPFES